MNIEQIAREAGLDKAYWLVDDSPVHKFADLYREALIAELVAGSEEPSVKAMTTFNEEVTFLTDMYMKEQLAGAVARERERILKLPQIKGNLFAEKAIRSGT